ncbi:hypothetical protein [Dankookia sp. P2]|uniref:hypothetical protein n=1 Tax=Dankookia sp. P2 TaxID=3423955 RepID=UPI003D67B717
MLDAMHSGDSAADAIAATTARWMGWCISRRTSRESGKRLFLLDAPAALYGTRRFVITTDNIAAARSKVAPGEMFRAVTRTVLLVQALASSSTKRVD